MSHNELINSRHRQHTYRSLPIWLHFVFLAIFGFANLFYGSIIVPILVKGMIEFGEVGLAAFFDGAPWLHIIASTPLFLMHFCFAISSLTGTLASLDVLKNRLLDASLKRTTGPKQMNNQMQGLS